MIRQHTDSQTFLTALFAGSIVLANVLAAKVAAIDFGLVTVTVPAGFVAIGVAFLATDLLGELHGRDTARRVVNATIPVLAVAYGLVAVAIAFPVASVGVPQAAFATTLDSGAAIVLASLVTLFVSQHVDVTVFHAIRERTNGRHKWARNLSSTGISQLVDTVLFIGLGFVVFPALLGGTPLPLVAVPGLVVGQYVAKLAVAALDTPLFYVATWLSDTSRSAATGDLA
jgi:hypothetical protein